VLRFQKIVSRNNTVLLQPVLKSKIPKKIFFLKVTFGNQAFIKSGICTITLVHGGYGRPHPEPPACNAIAMRMRVTFPYRAK